MGVWLGVFIDVNEVFEHRLARVGSGVQIGQHGGEVGTERVADSVTAPRRPDREGGKMSSGRCCQASRCDGEGRYGEIECFNLTN